MKKVIVILFLMLCKEGASQKIYITREGASRMTKRFNECRLLETKLAAATHEIKSLRSALIVKDIEFERERGALDSVIAMAEYDLWELTKKHEAAVKMLSRKKRKALERKY